MTEAEFVIDYMDPDGFKQVHKGRSEIEADGFSEEVREAIDVVSKEGFFLVMEQERYVFIPPSQVLRITFNLIKTEDGS